MVTSRNGHLCTVRNVDQKTREKRNEKCTAGHEFAKKLRIYCQEYCDYTGIHGIRYFGESRSCIEK